MTHRIASGFGLLAALALAVFSPALAASPPLLQAHPAGTAAAPVRAASPAAGSARAAAAPTHRQYDIELIVFRALKGMGSPEDWPAELKMAPTVSGSESPAGTGIGQLVSIVPASAYRLTPIWNALRVSPDYAPVAHAAWIQTASDWGTHAGFSLAELGIHVPGLSGMVYFERGMYLHLGLTLDYTMQHPPPGLGAAPGTTFVLNETRRVRFYQRNYFDHPAFGVIALVLPAHP